MHSQQLCEFEIGTINTNEFQRNGIIINTTPNFPTNVNSKWLSDRSWNTSTVRIIKFVKIFGDLTDFINQNGTPMHSQQLCEFEIGTINTNEFQRNGIIINTTPNFPTNVNSKWLSDRSWNTSTVRIIKFVKIFGD
eukprot:639766_1